VGLTPSPEDLEPITGAEESIVAKLKSRFADAYQGDQRFRDQLSVWVAQGLSDNEILQRMFMATLTRPPAAAEIQAVMAHKLTDRGMWLTSVQWALLQKIDFVFY